MWCTSDVLALINAGLQFRWGMLTRELIIIHNNACHVISHVLLATLKPAWPVHFSSITVSNWFVQGSIFHIQPVDFRCIYLKGFQQKSHFGLFVYNCREHTNKLKSISDICPFAHSVHLVQLLSQAKCSCNNITTINSFIQGNSRVGA